MSSPDNRLWYLVSVKLSGEASEEEISELNSLLKIYPEVGLKVDMIEKAWKKKAHIEVDLDSSFNKHLQRLSNHLSEPALQYDAEPSEEALAAPKARVRPLYKKLIGAAVVATSIMIAFFLFNSTSNKAAFASQNSVSTKMGSKSKIQLPDGTQVWLNADSKITYDENFNGSLREVNLIGEAYFDVVKDKERPFIIHTNTIDIKVLGTAFNVRSYPNDKATETALIHGSVEITLKESPDKKFVLKPHEKLVVQNTEATISKAEYKKTLDPIAPVITWAPVRALDKRDSLTYETSWVRNYLSFDEESLEQVVKKIERWYDVKVIVEDELIKNSSSTYSAVFEDEDLAVVMEALQIAGNFNYQIKRKEVIIKQ